MSGHSIVSIDTRDHVAMRHPNYPLEFPLKGENVHFYHGKDGIAFMIRTPDAPDWKFILDNSNQTAIKSPWHIDLLVEGHTWSDDEDFLMGRKCSIPIDALASVQACISHHSAPELIPLGSASLISIGEVDTLPDHVTLHYSLKQKIEKTIWTVIQGYEGWVIARGVEHSVIPDGSMVSWGEFFARWGSDYMGLVISRYHGDRLLGFNSGDRFALQYALPNGKTFDVVPRQPLALPESTLLVDSELCQLVEIESCFALSKDDALQHVIRYCSSGKMDLCSVRSG